MKRFVCTTCGTTCLATRWTGGDAEPQCPTWPEGDWRHTPGADATHRQAPMRPLSDDEDAVLRALTDLDATTWPKSRVAADVARAAEMGVRRARAALRSLIAAHAVRRRRSFATEYAFWRQAWGAGAPEARGET